MGRLVRKPQIPDLDAQIAGLEGVLQSGIGGLGGMQGAGPVQATITSNAWPNTSPPRSSGPR